MHTLATRLAAVSAEMVCAGELCGARSTATKRASFLVRVTVWLRSV